MNVSPVSFKSLLCFTIDDNKPKGSVETMIRTAFRFNKDLSGFQLVPQKQIHDKSYDATVHNANTEICRDLDKKYADKLKKNPKSVFLTEVTVHVDPRNTAKRYFLTAASTKAENRILYSSFAEGKDILVAKFIDKEG